MSFYIHGLRLWLKESEVSEHQIFKEYEMSQVGKPIKTVTIKPMAEPVPPKTTPAPTPVEQPVEQPVEVPA